MIDVLLGLQWGDEGKGKIVDYLAPKYDIVARFQGGPNAGHTLIINGQRFVLHTIPSGIFHDGTKNLIGNGVVINPVTLKMEIDGLEKIGADVRSKLYVSKKAHLILPTHIALDKASEEAKGKEKIGSTLRGIGPTYMDKTGRNGLRVGDLTRPDWRDRYNRLRDKHVNMLKRLYDVDYGNDPLEEEWLNTVEMIQSLQLVDSEYWLAEAMQKGEKILAEGAQGSLLDVDFGTYPFVTSSNTISSGVCNGLGVPPSTIGDVIGISKAYCTRVGSGPFPTQLDDADGEKLREEGGEFGATTGRPRRCGWIDLPALRYTIMLSGVTKLVITKVDVLNSFESFKACTAYKAEGQESENIPFDMVDCDIDPVYREFKGWNQEIGNARDFSELPRELGDYLEFLNEYLGVEISMISNGPEREKLIHRNI